MKINLLDLFSGIGGFHLGLEKAGYKINSYFSEVDKYAIEVYKNNFKNSNYVGSVTDVQSKDLPKINAITFGSPCQDFSLAGKRKGMEGSRSSLISEAIRLISECRPDFFIWENVKGTFSTNSGQDFWAIIQAFANIGGYRLEWQLLNTKWFLPQNRERIYLVGYLGGKSGGQIFPIGQCYKRDVVEKETSACITKSYHKGVNFDNQLIKIKSATKRGYELAKEGDSVNYAYPNSKLTRGRVGKGVSQTLDAGCQMAVVPARAREDGSGQPIIQNQSKIRRLTPLECERLQGFPDNWTKYGTQGIISDTQRYKMCGNAVTVDVVEAVAKRIITQKKHRENGK
jgi:DNA (cytosine-5)-methyltransferase 1